MADEPLPELRGRRAAFAMEYPIDLNGTKAAIRAGYSEKRAAEQACRMLQDPAVKAHIDKAMADRASRLGLSADWVLARLKQISDRCVQAEPARDAEGEETGWFKFDAAGANRATELIGKHLRMFTDKVEVTGGLRLTHEEALDELR